MADQASAAAPGAAAATVPGTSAVDGTGQEASSLAQPASTERLLDLLGELHKCQAGANQELQDSQQEHVEWSSKLLRLEQELYAEEQIGQDLSRRIETLEEAIRQERQFCERLESEDAGNLMRLDTFGTGRGTLLQPDVKDVPEVLAAYLERLPKNRVESCREVLQRRMHEACVDWQPTVRSPASDGELLQSSTWQHRWTLQAHLDGVRCVLCNPSCSALFSCGEDFLVKCWNLSSLWAGVPHADEIEPFVTLRGHAGPVTCLAMRVQERLLFSAGVESDIRAWHVPESFSFGGRPSTLRAGVLRGHSNSIWSLEQHAHLPLLASASADGKVGIWSTESESLATGSCSMQASYVLRLPGSAKDSDQQDAPACLAWVQTDASHLLAGYTSSRVALFDVRHGSQVFDLWPQGGEDPAQGGARVTSLCCSGFSQLAVLGDVDGGARLVDLASGSFVGKLDGHRGVVSSLSMHPAKAYCLVSGCHDGCVRSFDLRTGRCFQELMLHQSKYEEAVHCVRCTSRLLASAGAEGNICILVPSD